jgi:conjugative transfer signal peptidase TraF
VNRARTLITMTAAAALVTATMHPKPAPTLVWNASESVPIGLYRVQPAGKLTVTDLVVAMPPEPLATFLSEAGYLARGVPLMKRVLALPGQTVCRKGLVIRVDGIEMGLARERDSRGRPLPDWQDCRVVAKSDVFLMNWDEPASLDGRYFGPIAASSIIGRADPLWTFEEDLTMRPASTAPLESPCSNSILPLLHSRVGEIASTQTFDAYHASPMARRRWSHSFLPFRSRRDATVDQPHEHQQHQRSEPAWIS